MAEKVIVLDRNHAFEFKLDDEAAQEQVIRDAKKYGMAVLKPKTDYISREAARETLLTAYPLLQHERLDTVVSSIPAADVRPVVTCGKCKYGKYTGTEWFCDKHSGHADKFGEDASYHEYHSKYWFCADGEERKHE